MSRSVALIKESTRHVQMMLKELGLFGDKIVKRYAKKAEEMLKKSNEQIENIDYETLCAPFYEASKIDVEPLLLITIDFIATLFSFSDTEHYPSKELTEQALNILFRIDPKAKFDLHLKCCKAVNKIVVSYPGKCFIHGKLLYSLITYLVLLHDNSVESELVTEVIAMTMKEVLIVKLTEYDHPLDIPPKSDSLEEYSADIIDTLVKNSLEIIECVPEPNISASVHDVDIVGVFHAFAKAIEFHTFKPKTLVLAMNTLHSILCSKLQFYFKPFFKEVLQTDIHNMIMAAINDSTFDLAVPTAGSLICIWEHFSDYYFYQLNDILARGISNALASNNYKLIRKASKMMKILSMEPQLLVDCFVNYDCDAKGEFTHIFADTTIRLAEIVKACQNENERLQKMCLIALEKIFGSMWSYLQEQKRKDDDISPYLDIHNQHSLYDQCAHQFAVDPMNGLDQFIKHGFTGNSVGKFLALSPNLDKKSIGFVLGEKDDEIINDFFAEINVDDLPFPESFVNFFARLTLPTDQNRCERIIRRFSVWFFSSNKSHTISSVDTVYSLTLSALCIHAAKEKTVPFEAFVEMNKGIDRGKDLDSSILKNVYNSSTSIFIQIPHNSLFMTHTQISESVTSKATEALSQALAATQTKEGRVFDKAEDSLLIGPMFDSVWGGVQDAVFMAFENQLKGLNSKEIVDNCLSIVISAINISAHCYNDDALHDIMSYSMNIIDMCWSINDTNVPKQLYGTFSENGYYMRRIWPLFVQTLSQMSLNKSENAIDTLQIADTIFDRVNKFDRDALVEIASALCTVSKKEINEEKPRDFCLKRIFRICRLTVGRPVSIWKSLWSVVSLFLGGFSSSNHAFTVYVVDSIIELLSDYIETTTENDGFHIEEEILEPVFSIFTKANTKIAEHTFEKISELCKKHGKSLFSGWEVIFQIITVSATLEESVSTLGLDLFERILIDYMNSASDFMIHIISTLASFASCQSEMVKIRGVSLFLEIAKHITNDEIWKSFWDSFFRLFKASANVQQEMMTNSFVEILTTLTFTGNQWKYLLSSGSISHLPEDQRKKVADCLNAVVPKEESNEVENFLKRN